MQSHNPEGVSFVFLKEAANDPKGVKDKKATCNTCFKLECYTKYQKIAMLMRRLAPIKKHF